MKNASRSKKSTVVYKHSSAEREPAMKARRKGAKSKSAWETKAAKRKSAMRRSASSTFQPVHFKRRAAKADPAKGKSRRTSLKSAPADSQDALMRLAWLYLK
jgi:hypothetical protein